jgi:hypothetical protein
VKRRHVYGENAPQFPVCSHWPTCSFAASLLWVEVGRYGPGRSGSHTASLRSRTRCGTGVGNTPRDLDPGRPSPYWAARRA